MQENVMSYVRGFVGSGVLGLAILATTSCTEVTTEVEPTLTSLWENGLNSCYLNCHSPTGDGHLELGPDLSTKQKFYTNLVNKTAAVDYPVWTTWRTGSCNDVRFISPGSAANSTLVGSLNQQYADNIAASGCVMTYSIHSNLKVAVSQEVFDALVTWINDGAKNN